MHDEDSSRRTFIWLGVLFLLPIVFLAGVGFWALREQRDSVTERARQEAATLCARVAEDFEKALVRRLDESLFVPRSDVIALANGEPQGFFYDATPEPEPGSEAAEKLRNAIEDNGDLEEIAETYSDGRTEAGLPIPPLALYHVAMSRKDEASIERFAVSAVLDYPSAITAKLIEALVVKVPESSVATWRERWEKHEGIRKLLALHATRLVADWRSQWLGDHRVRIESDRNGLRCFGKGFVANVFSDVVAAESVPGYLALDAIYDGESIRSVNPAFDFASAKYGDTRIAALLMFPRELYRDYRRQMAWLAVLIGVAAVGAIVAYTANHRALLRQRELNRQQSNFVSSVSHELRAPVAAIRLMSERLKSGRVEDKAKEAEYYDFIERESQRLTGLINNVLDFSRVERGQKRYAFAETDVVKLVRETVTLMEPLADGRAIELELDDLSSDPVIDGMAVQQALANLLDNAIKYAPRESPITVRLREEDGRLFLSVRDRGPGVPEEDRARIFDRFYRAGSELRRETEGVGIGLSIVKRIAEAHGGTVALDTAPNKGSTFTVELPMKP